MTPAYASIDNVPDEDGGPSPMTSAEEEEVSVEATDETDLSTHHHEVDSRKGRGVNEDHPQHTAQPADQPELPTAPEAKDTKPKRVKAVAPHPHAQTRHPHSAEEDGAEEHHDYALALYLPVSNQYVWRGILYEEAWNVQPYVSFSIFDVGPGTLGLNTWAYVSFESNTHELSPGLTYNLSGENYSITPGYSVFITTANWDPYFHAFYAKADFLQSFPIFPTVGVIVDPFRQTLVLGFGGLKVSHNFGKLSVGGRALIGALYDYDLEEVDGQQPSARVVLHHIDPNVYVSYPFGKYVHLQVTGGYGYDGRAKQGNPWWQVTPSVTF